MDGKAAISDMTSLAAPIRLPAATVDDYEEYCKGHPDYPNNRAVLAIENIRAVYMERLKRRDFLPESNAARHKEE